MFSRVLAVLIFVIFSLGMLFFFYTNESYELSFKARFYYSISNYEKAYELSKKAAELDWKNKMASSVLIRSEVALRYENYIKQGEEYMAKIRALSAVGIGRADKERIGLMCDIMQTQFDMLGAKGHAPDDLLELAKRSKDSFARLKSELF